MRDDSAGCPSWSSILSNLMTAASFMLHFAKLKRLKLSKFSMKVLFLSSVLQSDLSRLFPETDEFCRPTSFRSAEKNKILLSTNTFQSDINMYFDNDSFPLMLDTGASSDATPFKLDFIKGAHKTLKGTTMSRIAS